MGEYIDVIFSPVVHTFGYGDKHDIDLLTKISDAGAGIYYAIPSEDHFAERFGLALGGITTTVVNDIQVTLDRADNCEILSVREGASESIPSSSSSNIWTLKYVDLYAKEERDIIVHMTLPPFDGDPDFIDQTVMLITLKYYNPRKEEYYFDF